MPDLKIPNLDMNSNKYIFKKKLSLRRKSKRRLFIESAFMFSFSVFLIYINYLIPNKNLLLQNLSTTLKRSFEIFFDLSSNLSEIFLVIFILISYSLSLILFVGSFYRMVRIIKRKTKMVNYK